MNFMKYTKFDRTLHNLQIYNILLQNYITEFVVNYFLRNVIRVWAWFGFLYHINIQQTVLPADDLHALVHKHTHNQ